ncbi:MAG: NAD(P)(+) transhydrogenase (Re/Si-specific) subunit beta [Thermomicrobiales bacterium]|nr:NAD(P)(+) transhydrogenase (Re/Si-specific) subunit beta [Thermomicrobiales bacterium]MCO5217468.1 NAD(P)(+) transhydrogenase (Re/Si-specific) subunit beta [Thermomicrobiales bacterium]MCO5223949.1 NAD(P)(+) transhydrogenase (Re/Si-specific) subunit beta [Thermomicrobiales bacterium]MCO5226763.1 NAD(P)(+) transhydrogenase (Re/Si-specific) subunit beta [Thermomicrobiales bacterium]
MIDNWGRAIVDLIYLLSAALFVVAIWRLSSPRTARQGNTFAVAGMGLAILATFFHESIDKNYIWMVLAMVVGGAPGYVIAMRVKMTAMPQMVAMFNGLGGLASAFIGVSEALGKSNIATGTFATIVLGAVIGSLTFTGSLVAYAKLQGIKSVTSFKLPVERNLVAFASVGSMIVLIIASILAGSGGLGDTLLVIAFIVALVAGFLLVVPIGGADMPVVIAILNAFSGIAGILTGFALNLQPLIVAGTLVGASGLFLSLLMAKAMNRSLVNVIFGSFGAAAVKGGIESSGEAKPIRETTVEDAGISLGYAKRVIVVPGYGLAVAQAQHAVQELATVLQARGVNVRYAIHPVAGRMPGHMNVLLAEANVPYEDLYEMDAINDDFQRTDVALVIGANDVTNPAARDDPSSPIYGMPILKVDDAERVIVLKRGMSPGFAGVENELFHKPQTNMLFGDAKDSLQKLVGAVREA